MGIVRILGLGMALILSTAGAAGAAGSTPAVPAVAASAPVAVSDAATAARLAVNRLEPSGEGLRLRHPRRQVDFTPEGVRVSGRRGTAWSWRLTGVHAAADRPLLRPGSTRPSAVGRDKVVYDRIALREEYLLGTDSIEQQFVLPRPLPLGGEDLVVLGEVRASGTWSESARGWSWRDANGEVTLGRVSVADASGRALPSRFEVSPTGTRLTIAGQGLSSAVYPVVIDPEIGSNDVRISDMGPDGDADYDGLNPAVAYNSIDNNYLVVWEGDDTPGDLVEGEMEIFGQILSANGSEVAYSDVRISFTGPDGNTAYRARNPAVAFNTVYNQYLVVWEADNPDTGLADNEFEIWGQVVDPLLFPLWGGNFRISSMGPDGNAFFDAARPAVAYNPSPDEYLVVWDGDDDSGSLVDEELEIWAQRVYSTAVLVGSNMRVSDMGGTGDPAYDALAADVAYNTTDHQYLVVWQGDDDAVGLVDDEFEIYGQRMDQNLGGLGANDARISDAGGDGDAAYGAFSPSVAYNSVDNEYLVVWMGDDNVGGLVDNETEVFSQRMNATLGGLGSNDYRLTDVGGVGNATYRVTWGPDLAYNALNNEYMVTWSGEDTVDGMVNNEEEVFVQRMTADIGGSGPNDERISDVGGLGSIVRHALVPVIAANAANGQFLVAWQADDDVGGLAQGEYEIYIQRMEGSPLFVDGFESGDPSAWSATVP